ncbi:TetR family transcriptional regulator [Pandoraea faecigallinarum]|uniref:TetR family transcriptional regulator n=1 Tax=Pandoraea faecigallinarum TaxID=656179 RepID=A0A0H3WWW3_9BURK|nr:TetR/AcrR family transcriptional regulator [Pandoraea faecigallinarum]AKM31031.1 TetR family transcriptional regulator [Pandoraea faecigallinarum]
MRRPRGRPAQGTGVTREAIVATALALLDEKSEGGEGGRGLSMRALAARLGVTPMSLYHHIGDHAGLLRAVSDEVYASVLEGIETGLTCRAEIREILIRYHDAVCRHPQLTLAIFATPRAFAGVTRRITDRLTGLLRAMTTAPELWRDILIDHAHGSGLPFAHNDHAGALPAPDDSAYRQALDCLLDGLAAPRSPAGRNFPGTA